MSVLFCFVLFLRDSRICFHAKSLNEKIDLMMLFQSEGMDQKGDVSRKWRSGLSCWLCCWDHSPTCGGRKIKHGDKLR